MDKLRFCNVCPAARNICGATCWAVPAVGFFHWAGDRSGIPPLPPAGPSALEDADLFARCAQSVFHHAEVGGGGAAAAGAPAVGNAGVA